MLLPDFLRRFNAVSSWASLTNNYDNRLIHAIVALSHSCLCLSSRILLPQQQRGTTLAFRAKRTPEKPMAQVLR
jgi:hypothetical protein